MTYNFGLNMGEVIRQAYSRVGLRGTQISQQHILDAQNEANLLFVEWANKGPTLWTVDKTSVSLTQSVATYVVDPSTITVTDAWITSGSPSYDRPLTSISRGEYADFPNKTRTGFPTSFWFDRTSTPTMTLWPVPDGAGYVLNFYRFSQSQDAVISAGQAPSIPYRWLDALTWGLAERLCFVYAPDKLPIISPRAMMAYDVAAEQDTENAPLDMTVDVSGYWR